MRAYEHELPWALLQERLAELDMASQGFDYDKVLSLLAALVQEYAPARHDSGDLAWQILMDGRGCCSSIEYI